MKLLQVLLPHNKSVLTEPVPDPEQYFLQAANIAHHAGYRQHEWVVFESDEKINIEDCKNPSIIATSMDAPKEIANRLPTCLTCENCLCVDHGYSNWTVEGTVMHCILNVHPDFPCDRWYGENPKSEFARNCEQYVRTDECPWLDVDGEQFEHLPDDHRAYIDKEEGNF